MICAPCAKCADAGTQGEEAHLEAGCEGCDCEHRVGTPEELYNVTGKPIFPVG